MKRIRICIMNGLSLYCDRILKEHDLYYLYFGDEIISVVDNEIFKHNLRLDKSFSRHHDSKNKYYKLEV